MNSIFSWIDKLFLEARPLTARAIVFMGLVIFGASSFVTLVRAQAPGDPSAEFKRISEELSAARLSGGTENQALMEKALAYLDSIAISGLNIPGEPNLDGMNRGLAALVSHTPPVGENYRLVKLGSAPASYALVVNFGLGGPAAVRIYTGSAANYSLAAKIDHFVQKDFLDSDLELVPVSDSAPVFVTISGRTDDLSTGMFSAWRLDGHRILNLWNSDLLQQSSYAADEKGFGLAYCSEVDEDRPSQCLKMSRDVYRFEAGEWKRTETADMSVPGPAAK
jgi:hypothetical protein